MKKKKIENNNDNNNNNKYKLYSFIDLEERKKNEKLLEEFEELEFDDDKFEIINGFKKYEKEDWEVISTESKELD